MKTYLYLLLIVGISSSPVATAAGDAALPPKLDAFADGVNHYKNGSDRDGYPRYLPEQVDEIATNLLRYQRSNGGWPSNRDPLRILTSTEIAEVEAERDKLDSTLDNRSTYPEIEYLADAFARSQNTAYRDAALRGIVYLLEAQHPCGGWPHSYPDANNYRPHVTFMDDVTVGSLGTMRKLADGGPPFDFLPEALRAQCRESAARGEAALLNLQVVVAGQPTVWAGQYDEMTLLPTSARSFELPSLVSAESVNAVRYLMQIDPPKPEHIRAIRGAIAWYQRSVVRGIRIDRVPIDPVRFPAHTAKLDVVAVEDPAAPSIWARFYEIDTNRPFMANRDGVKVYTLAEVQLERRTGYSWYTNAPTALLEKEYPAWCARWAALLD